MEETVHDITTKIIRSKKSMKSTDKEEVEVSLNLKTPINNTMHTLFYSNIYEFSINLEGMLIEGTYKTTIHNINKLGWKAQFFKSPDVSMLGHSFGVSQYPQFYDRTKEKYQMLPHPYVGSYSGEKSHQFLQEPWIIALTKSVETFLWLQ